VYLSADAPSVGGKRGRAMAFEQAARQRSIEILCEEWQRGSGAVESKTIYDRLQSEGITPGPGDMESLLVALETEGFIRAATYNDREGTGEHGAMVITYVAKEGLC
jgi:hypothetical protein